jgi:hypothetical protein
MRGLLLIRTALVVLTVCAAGRAQESAVLRRARAYEPYIAQSAARHGVDPRLLWTIAYLESRFRPEAVSYKGGRPCARGMMQFVPGTAARYGLSNPHDPEPAIDAAARYVRDLTARFGGRLDLILAGYNAGEGAVEAFRDGRRLVLPTGKVINPSGVRTGGVPPYGETRGYVSHGASVFSNITAAKIFNAGPVVRLRRPAGAAAATEVAGGPAATTEEKAPQASIYLAAPAEVTEAPTSAGSGGEINPTTRTLPVAKSAANASPPKRPETRSIYFTDN